MTARPALATLVWCVLAHAGAWGAPAMDWLFPAGARRGDMVEVAVGGKFDTWPARFVCNNPALTIKPLATKGKLSITVAADAPPVPCLIRAVDDTGPGNARPFIVGALPEVAAREPDNEPASALLVKHPAVVNGKLERNGDVDCFSVELKAGQTLAASLLAHQVLTSPMDALLQVVSPSGIVLAQNNDAGSLDPEIIFQATESGPHIVRLFAFPSMPDSSIRFAGGEGYVYRLTLTTGPFPRHAWPLSVPSGKKQGISARGWNLDATGGQGKLVATSPSGFGLVVADGWPNFQMVLLGDSEPVVWSKDLSKPLGLPLWLSTQSQGKEASVVTVELGKGVDYRLQAWSSGLGLNMFPSVALVDPAGKTIQKFEPKGLHEDLDATFKATSAGNHRLEIREAHGTTGDRRVCLVHLAPAQPDFTAKLGAETLVAEAGKAASLQVSVSRAGGLAGNPSFRVEGLPTDIPWTVEPDKDPAKPVKINFGPSKDGELFSGPVKVFARVGDRPEKQMWTGSNIPGLEVREVWIHLPPAKPKAKEKEPAQKDTPQKKK